LHSPAQAPLIVFQNAPPPLYSHQMLAAYCQQVEVQGVLLERRMPDPNHLVVLLPFFYSTK
jgi:hypothetical protein